MTVIEQNRNNKERMTKDELELWLRDPITGVLMKWASSVRQGTGGDLEILSNKFNRTTEFNHEILTKYLAQLHGRNLVLDKILEINDLTSDSLLDDYIDFKDESLGVQS